MFEHNTRPRPPARCRSAINELKQAFDVTAVGGGSGGSSMDTPMAETPLETPINTVVGPRAGGVRFAPVPEDTPAPPPRRTTQVGPRRAGGFRA